MLDSCRALEGEGFTVTYLPVSTTGRISLENLEKAITPETSLVSIMTVNNEIGVKQPIEEIGMKFILFYLFFIIYTREFLILEVCGYHRDNPETCSYR